MGEGSAFLERFWDWNLSALLVFLLIDTFMQPRCRNLIERDAESVPPGAHRNQSDYERNNGVNLNQGSHIRNDSRK